MMLGFYTAASGFDLRGVLPGGTGKVVLVERPPPVGDEPPPEPPPSPLQPKEPEE